MMTLFAFQLARTSARCATEGLGMYSARFQAPPFALSASWKCLASTPAFARCSQVIFGPCGPYTFTNCALVGRPAGQRAECPQPISARAALDLTDWICFHEHERSERALTLLSRFPSQLKF